eukprot:COSAG02_NODE_2733_length_8136_cov_35.604454_12_plen_40_part_00
MLQKIVMPPGYVSTMMKSMKEAGTSIIDSFLPGNKTSAK